MTLQQLLHRRCYLRTLPFLVDRLTCPCSTLMPVMWRCHSGIIQIM
ncbi:hypothetical protein MtrunA17_Chr3g0137211 [Medicago truncatula]|uniref:Uncharacterized protein n=1 Tax=Medicago truncatula TaxID=3880 RepID=A0A396J1L9_MEDTR|nr:hypothetical protein MtrunA17_Chr3g0137211 [Medicago truncatula]